MQDHDIFVPKISEDMGEVVLLEWLKKEGDCVKLGEAVFSIQTDKAIFEIESEWGGYLKKIIVPAGSVAKMLDIVGIISTEKKNTRC